MKSLGDIFRKALEHHETREMPGSDTHERDEESPYLLLGQKAKSPQKRADSRTAENPSKQEIRDYLASLAEAYYLPTDLVQAVAMTESTYDPLKVHHNPAHKAKNGRSTPPTIDYGLMQINRSKIGKKRVKDPQGNKFKIGADVKSDWKANARVGVALLQEQYELAQIEQGAITSEQIAHSKRIQGTTAETGIATATCTRIGMASPTTKMTGTL
jgi:hypothetical protein